MTTYTSLRKQIKNQQSPIMPCKQSVKRQSIKAIILAGGRDFGRCPLASRLPTALWPVVDKPALEYLLQHLACQGIKQATVCSNGDASLLQRSIVSVNSMQLKFLDEPLPVGTAGCIRDTANGDTNELFFVFPVGIISPPNVDTLIRAHQAGKSDLTVMLKPEVGNGDSGNRVSGVYICESEVLDYIPKEGYCDIKEGLIPAILRAGKTIHCATLPRSTRNFRSRVEYLAAIANYLDDSENLDIGLPRRRFNGSKDIWIANSAKVDQRAQVYGPVVIMDNATISEEAIVFGPTVVGRKTNIGKGSLIVNSVLWDGVWIGENCEIQGCIIDYQAVVRSHTVVEEKSIPFKPEGILRSSVSSVLKVANDKVSRLRQVLQSQLDRVDERLPNWAKSHKTNILPLFAACFVLIAFLWSYWPGLVDLWNVWQRSDEYSSGLLVPFLAFYILWSRRHNISQYRIRPCVWGLFAFLTVQLVRLFGLFFMYGSAERLSIVLSIAALVLLLFGWQFFRKVSAVLLFLCLMLPWPNRVQTAVALPLQRWATSSAVFSLEMMGYDVVQEGNIIHVGRATVAVAEACNGLRMITAFFVISGLVVLLVKRAWWQKLTILASSLPIALLCNSVRLAITALAFTVLSGEHWEKIFHNFGGYAMMPLALAAVVAEFWLLARLTILPTKKEAIIIKRQKR